MKVWLVRHAKSSWSKPGLSDFSRPLNGRGERDGLQMAVWLASQSHPAQWLWISPAARAVATSHFVQKGFQLPDDSVVQAGELYHADQHTLLEVIQRTPAAVSSVALVAHNPGLTSMVNLLGTEPVTDNLKTFGIARFDYAGDWHSLTERTCTLDFLVSPKSVA